MRKALKVMAIVLALAGSAASARAAGVSVTLKGGYFFPSASVFQDVYKGVPVFVGEVAVPLTGVLHLWAGAEYFGKMGLLSVSEEETKLRIVPLFLGLRCHFGKKSVRPYIGAAAAYFLFKEENPLGSVSKNGLGFIGQAGLLFEVGGPIWLDIFGNYRVCTLRTDDADPLEANIGGITAGGGLVLRF